MIDVRPINCPLKKIIRVPGDKSVSHRAVILSALTDTPVEVSNFLAAQDCLSTVACMKALGARVEQSDDKILITGHGLHEPSNVLDAGNSGTTVRLLTGLLAAQNFFAVFTGDDSLRSRPMARVIKPLTLMGAKISARRENFLPLAILPAEKLHGINYQMPVASAQVKSAILLAGLFASSPTTIIEPVPSRDHTEKMLAAFGVRVERSGNAITLRPPNELHAPEKISVPNDISSAAFFMVFATILPDSEVTLPDVGVNPSRAGIIDVLRRMGAEIILRNEKISGGELRADLIVRHAELRAVEFGREIIPRLIDEIPALAVAAAFAEGTSVFRDLSELRVKESDRLAAIVDEFNKISPGSFAAAGNDLIIRGRRPTHLAACKTLGDHRLAMALSIFGAAAHGVELDDHRCVDISFPNFFDLLA